MRAPGDGGAAQPVGSGQREGWKEEAPGATRRDDETQNWLTYSPEYLSEFT